MKTAEEYEAIIARLKEDKDILERELRRQIDIEGAIQQEWKFGLARKVDMLNIDVQRLHDKLFESRKENCELKVKYAEVSEEYGNLVARYTALQDRYSKTFKARMDNYAFQKLLRRSRRSSQGACTRS